MMWYGTMVFGWILWIVIVAVIIWLLIYIIKMQRPTEHGRGDRSMEILKERFARGEIDQEEFEQRRKILLK